MIPTESLLSGHSLLTRENICWARIEWPPSSKKFDSGTSIRAVMFGRSEPHTLARRFSVSDIFNVIDDVLLFAQERSAAFGNGSDGRSILPFGSRRNLVDETRHRKYSLRGIRAMGIKSFGTAYSGSFLETNFLQFSDNVLNSLSIWPSDCSGRLFSSCSAFEACFRCSNHRFVSGTKYVTSVCSSSLSLRRSVTFSLINGCCDKCVSISPSSIRNPRIFTCIFIIVLDHMPGHKSSTIVANNQKASSSYPI